MPITSYTIWSPRTWSGGEDVTASLMNVQVRDHLNAVRNEHFLTGVGRGVQLRTDATSPLSKVTLERFDEIVMHDGTRHNNWTAPLTADITVSGANGLDTGSEAASNWYEVHMIAKDDGTKALLLHLAPSYYGDAANASASTSVTIRSAAANTKQGQSFQALSAAHGLSHVDVPLQRTGSPSGTLTMELTDASHNVLATSYPISAGVIATGSFQTVRFVFPVPYTVALATTYFLQLGGTYTIDGANYVSLQTNASDVYASGNRYTYDGSTWTSTTGDWVFTTYVQRARSAPTLPTGYTKYCLIGYVFNNASSNFVAFRALDREVRHGAQVLVSGGSATFATLLSLYTITPPVATMIYPAYFASVANDFFKIGGVPDGYDLTFAGLGNTSSIQVATTGNSDVQNQMAPVLVDRLGIYYMRLSGTGTLTLCSYGYRW